MTVIEFGGWADATEACLSFESVPETMRTPLKLRAMWTDIEGNPVDTVLSGSLAQAFRHEQFHTQGQTMVDRMGPLQRRLFMAKVQKAAKAAARRAS